MNLKNFFSILLLISPLCHADLTTFVDNGFHYSDADPSKIEISVVTTGAAQDLMNKIIAQKDKIALFNPTDCDQRTTLIGRWAESLPQPVILGRVYLEGHVNLFPVGAARPHPTGGMHVASVVGIKDSSGNISTMILDPTFFDHPVSISEWRAKLEMPGIGDFKMYFGNRFQYNAQKGSVQPYRNAWNPQDVADAERINAHWLPNSLSPYFPIAGVSS